MSIDKRKVKKALGLSIAAVGNSLLSGLSIAAKNKKSSVYENAPREDGMEGKKVVFVKNDHDKENADGMRGHLEAVGDSEYKPNFYDKYVKRMIDIVLSFGGLVVLSPIFAVIALAIIIEDPGPVLFTQKRVGQDKKYFKLHKFRSMKTVQHHMMYRHICWKIRTVYNEGLESLSVHTVWMNYRRFGIFL